MKYISDTATKGQKGKVLKYRTLADIVSNIIQSGDRKSCAMK